MSPETVMGAVSLILRLLILFVSLKCAILILRADNHGEPAATNARRSVPAAEPEISTDCTSAFRARPADDARRRRRWQPHTVARKRA